MILAIYNFIYISIGILFFPLLLLIILSRKKYQGRTLERLGLKSKQIQVNNTKGPVIWVHALSVGEVTSAVPLIKGLRADRAEAVIILTVGTSSGRKTAEHLLSSSVELILSSPFDLRFAVQRYITAFQPDIFIQVETDFWPNWLSLLRKNAIPAMLVNGRISERSFAAYQRFAFFFRPMFCSFALLSMQTEEDCRKMALLGVPGERVITLGNLKYDMERPGKQYTEQHTELPGLAREALVWVCGSTHPGEEKILFSAFAQLLAQQEQLFLVLAPRDINRGQELVELAASFGLAPELRSRAAGNSPKNRAKGRAKGRVLILDTLGELAGWYGQADLAFVGGSLVPQGGHNPIEPAIHGVPVLFGPHMEDFSEIARELVDCRGGKKVGGNSLPATLALLLGDKEKRILMGQAAHTLVEHHRGGVQRHVQVINDVLDHAG
ncbi:3-deoxy-D-manno-octulosonic acid transferase [Candidatus Electrothrix sp.]|uniref:3-deoxy-D-manno-octulosonic acid transferase n=1 Tax=Candidatus Electrothrix sp. TaxID=2170559 RepID=UPI00405677D1